MPAECPVEAISPEDGVPDRWQVFTSINAAFGDGLDVVDGQVERYTAVHELQQDGR